MNTETEGMTPELAEKLEKLRVLVVKWAAEGARLPADAIFEVLSGKIAQLELRVERLERERRGNHQWLNWN